MVWRLLEHFIIRRFLLSGLAQKLGENKLRDPDGEAFHDFPDANESHTDEAAEKPPDFTYHVLSLQTNRDKGELS